MKIYGMLAVLGNFVLRIAVIGLKSILVVTILLCVLLVIIIVYGLNGLNKAEQKRLNLQKAYETADKKCIVKLVTVGPQKVKIIRTLRDFIDWDLVVTKQKIEMPLPVVISFGMPLELAQELKRQLEKLETVVEIS